MLAACDPNYTALAHPCDYFSGIFRLRYHSWALRDFGHLRSWSSICKRYVVCALFLLCASGIASSGQASPAATLDQYQPGPRPEDGFALSGAQPGPHLHFAAALHLDYARDPLVYENVAGEPSSSRVSLVSDQLRAQGAFSLGLLDAALLYLVVPVDLWMQGDKLGPQPTATGFGAGDLLLGGRLALHRGKIAAVALQVGVTAPTGKAGAAERPGVAGEAGVTGHPEITSEILAGPLSVLINVGVLMRKDSQFAGTRFTNALTFGTGVSVPIVRERLRALAEVHGASPLDDVGRRGGSPLEALLGIKLMPATGLSFGLAGGAGLLRGYGSPSMRAVLMLGYSSASEAGRSSEQRPPPPPPEPPPEPAPVTAVAVEEPVPVEPEDRDHDGVSDAEDDCPLAPGPIDRAGCPRFLHYDEHSGEIAFEPALRFTGDAKGLQPNSASELEELIALLAANPAIKLRIEAHVQRDGDAHRATRHSVQHAAVAARWLIEHGVAVNRLEAVGCGDNRPIAPEHSSQRAKNERVVAYVIHPLPETGLRSSLGCTAVEIAPRPEPAPAVLKEPEPRAPEPAPKKPEPAPAPTPPPPKAPPVTSAPLTLVPPTSGEAYRVDLAAGRIELLKPIRFDEGTAVISARSVPYVVEIAASLRANPRLRVAVESHVAADGGAQASLALSQERARAVRKRLADNGVAPERIKAYGCGENRPIAPANVPWGRKKNDRVELPLLDPAPSTGVHSTEGCSLSE